MLEFSDCAFKNRLKLEVEFLFAVLQIIIPVVVFHEFLYGVEVVGFLEDVAEVFEFVAVPVEVFFLVLVAHGVVLVDEELEVEVKELFVEGGGLFVGDEDGGVFVAHFHEFEEGLEVDSFGVPEHPSILNLKEHVSKIF